ncbi:MULTISPECIES: ABC transporter permease [Acidithiobacillus]|jgi:ABC-2 type transport system permease protein|uniref:ABC transporter permease n=1 Tax=Acidithiobacillus TaxID=119977 RepID=UPI0009BE42F5|nr:MULTISPECIES: ABC transporter permease [Acidithiobacillus]AUW31803.1 metal-dependent hydrolase [Acidithiobacillus caldus]MBU2730186.1 ABC transporter permease [Acidithiobacillus caldus]MBU2734649.1 ABC transporter permease [Acidithiobacillus caldus ATCC 51756]MBU2744265.1 ABC transporter permease [Acidithiobacillus caldus]MBU2764550.1 ABC transporter permease [Acidithiobacillus caldus]
MPELPTLGSGATRGNPCASPSRLGTSDPRGLPQGVHLTPTLTLFRKEVLRFAKVWLQTIAAPLVTTLLYLLVFGHALGGRVTVYPGVDYTTFIVPGLMMMSVLQNAFANSSSSLIQSKVTGNIVFLLLSPLSPTEIFLAMTAAAIVRGAAVGLAILALALLYLQIPILHPLWVVIFTILGAGGMGALGIIAGLWAEKFDQIAGFQNFLIMPLTFLAGVFYSVQSLPGVWRSFSMVNPFFYIIDGFRYGFFADADVSVWVSLAVALVFFLLAGGWAWWLLYRGYKLRP